MNRKRALEIARDRLECLDKFQPKLKASQKH